MNSKDLLSVIEIKLLITYNKWIKQLTIDKLCGLLGKK